MTAPGRWSWIDLRLVPAAATAWLTALVAPALPARVLPVVAAVALAAGLLLVRTGRSASWVVTGVLVSLALGATAAAVRGWAGESSPLHAAGERRQTLTVELRLDEPPRRLTGVGPPRVVADATVSRVLGPSGRAHVDDAVLLFAPADTWTDLAPGQPVRVRAAAAAPQEAGLVAVLSARGPPEPTGRPGWPHRVASSLRTGLAESSARVLDRGAGGLLPGLVVGDTGAMDPVLTENFRRTGLSHLTAVSGVNVS